jgi:hypothetical protein
VYRARKSKALLWQVCREKATILVGSNR